MANLISFPFRLTPNGAIATREDGTPDYLAEELAVLLLTQPGERDLVPDYGVIDPTFAKEFDLQELEAKISMFGPPVRILEVRSAYPSDGLHNLTVTFEPVSEDDDFESGISEFNDTNTEVEGIFDGFA